MADTDPLSAALAEIRERNEWRIRFHAYTEFTVEREAAEGDVRRLLAALDAALKLAGGARTALAGCAPCSGTCESGPCDCSGVRPLAWDLDPGAVCAAVLAELTGKGKNGG